MTDETIDSGLPSMSADEDAFFSSGGEKPIPTETTQATETSENTETRETTVEPKGEDKVVPGAQTPPDRLLAAVHEERGKRKGLEKELRDAQAKLSNFEGRFAVLDKLAPKADPATEQPVVPSAEEDIFGKVKHTDETIAQIQKRLDDAEAATKTANEHTAFRNKYVADADAFQAKTPDYRAAYGHLLQSRAAELIGIGYDDPAALKASGAPDEEVQAAAVALHNAIVADEAGIAQLAFSKGKSPAEIIYNLAKQRGYKGAAPAAPVKPKAEEQLDRIEQGQSGNKSLNDVGGSGGEADMTAERLIAMPMDEYESWVSKNPAKARRLMGG